MTNNISDVQFKILDQKNDHRGFLIKNFSIDLFPQFESKNVFESFFTTSLKNVLRGFHLQTPPFDCAKIVTCLSGEIFDVVIDIRKESPSYLKIDTFNLKSIRPAALYIPKGCLHGFLSLSDQSTLHYLQNAPYNKEHDSGFHYKSFSVPWPTSEKFIVSERDENLEKFI